MVNIEVPSSPVAEPAVKKAKLESLNVVNDDVHQYTVHFLKMNENATAPCLKSEFAAGAELYAAEDCVVPKNGKLLVSTAIKIALPKGTYGRVAPKSGLAFKNQIEVGAGVVDEDYRGEVKVLLFNFGQEDYNVKKSDRIAQLICQEISSTCELPEPKKEVVEVHRSNDEVKMPMIEAPGMILYSNEDNSIPSKGFVSLSTGISLTLPAGYYGRVAPLKKLAVEHSILNFAGVVDQDFRGEIRVLLYNFSGEAFEIKKGDAVAQLLVEKVATCTYEEVKELTETTRGEGGFGSTGTNQMDTAAQGAGDAAAVQKAISFEKLNDDAQEPVYGTPYAAGADVYSYEDVTVPAGGKAMVSTGVKLNIKPGHYARVAPRSGLAVKNFIHVGAGVEVGGDEELKVLLLNYGDTDFAVKKGDRIAQVVAERIAIIDIKEK